MNIVSGRTKARLLNIICLLVGTMMLVRSYSDSAYPGYTQRQLLAPIFLGGALGVFLMYRRYKEGWWLFTALNVLLGIWFIFVLEDVWYHHVAPHIVFSAVFLPFYGDMRWIDWSAMRARLRGRAAVQERTTGECSSEQATPVG